MAEEEEERGTAAWRRGGDGAVGCGGVKKGTVMEKGRVRTELDGGRGCAIESGLNSLFHWI
jgi:hypothetical protein